MLADDQVWVVVLAGGIGSRFWPVSTPERPKQVLPLAGDRPLIADTIERARALVPDERIRILAGEHLGDLAQRRPEAVIHHSDRGCQYTSGDYRAQLASLGVTVSMSRKGNCWDKAVVESLFHTLKIELVHHRRYLTSSSAFPKLGLSQVGGIKQLLRT